LAGSKAEAGLQLVHTCFDPGIARQTTRFTR
jgi:hypothetical protein